MPNFFKSSLYISFVTLLLSVPNISSAQKSDLKIQIAATVSYLERADEYSNNCFDLLKKSLKTKDKAEIKKIADEAMKLAQKAKEQSDLAEQKADQIEIAAKKMGCFAAAAEADDAEDYCRQLGYFTYEIGIYTKKSVNELELVYMQEYLNKAVAYAEDAYESLKNARAELENAAKDVDGCN